MVSPPSRPAKGKLSVDMLALSIFPLRRFFLLEFIFLEQIPAAELQFMGEALAGESVGCIDLWEGFSSLAVASVSFFNLHRPTPGLVMPL